MRDWHDFVPGVWDEHTRYIFTHGWCSALALSLHHLTGWPLVLEEDWRHVAVEMPDGRILDAKGARERHDFGALEHVAPDDLPDYGVVVREDGSLEPQKDAHAEEFAAALLRDLDV